MRNLSGLIGLLSIIIFTSGCGTIAGTITKGKRPVFLIDVPKDAVVNVDGKKLDMEMEAFASGGVGNVTNTYYAPSVKLPYKHNTTIEISSMGRTGIVDLKPTNQSAIFWGNLLFAPIVGHIIDGVTKNNKTLGPRYVDVAAVLAGKKPSEWRSKSKLKKMSKQQGRKNKTVSYS